MTRVILYDNYPLYRTGVANLLKKEFEGIQVYLADDMQTVDKLLAEKKIHLIIYSQSDIGKSCFTAVRKLKNSYPAIKIIVTCIYPESSYTYRVLKSGASCYLSRKCSIPVFVQAVKTVLAGEEYILPSAAKDLLEKVHKKKKKVLIENLSDRELQILKLIASGKSNKSIATEKRLKRTTVSTYRTRLLEKLKLKNNIQLARFAIEQHLV